MVLGNMIGFHTGDLSQQVVSQAVLHIIYSILMTHTYSHVFSLSLTTSTRYPFTIARLVWKKSPVLKILVEPSTISIPEILVGLCYTTKNSETNF